MYVVVGFIAVAVFARTLSYPFVYDDRYIIERNPAVTEPGGWGEVFSSPYWPPRQSFDPLYRPLTTLSLKLNYVISGDPFGFRAVNLGLHGLAAVLVAVLARRWWGRDSAAWVAGVLFAVHPLHAETLGLVVGRGELLATVLITGMLVRHVARPAGAAPSVGYHISVAGLFLLGLGSKEMAAIGWPAVLLVDLWRRRADSGAESMREYLRRIVASHHLGMLFALAAFLFMRWVIFGGRTTLPEDFVNVYANPLVSAPLSARLTTPFALLWLMVRQWFVAAPLCPIWSVGGFELPTSPLRGDVAAGVVIMLAGLAAMVGGWRRGRCWWVPVCLLILGVLLPCHFIPSANWLYAERWAYLPSTFAAVLCAGLAVSVPRFSVAGATTVTLLFTAVTLPYQRCWATHSRLFESVVERQPLSYHGLVGLAAVRDSDGRLGEVEDEVGRLVRQFPDAVRAWRYEVLLAVELGDWDRAAEGLRRWGALRGPGPPPKRMARVAELVREHGR